jgi:hypothetical protein
MAANGSQRQPTCKSLSKSACSALNMGSRSGFWHGMSQKEPMYTRITSGVFTTCSQDDDEAYNY